MSNRYINERFLPDKAIDVVDEAASHIRIRSDSKPEQLEAIDRQIVQLKIEQAALLREDNETNQTAKHISEQLKSTRLSQKN